MEKLNRIVEECLYQHTGGEEFFDALDKEVQDDEILDRLQDLVYGWNASKGYTDEQIGIIVSGKFGLWFKDRDEFCVLDDDEPVTIVVEGGLRHKVSSMRKHLDLSYIKEDGYPKKWIFIDDSFYSGKTKEVIRRSLKTVGCKLLHTFVVYDGSPYKSELVSSLYRYYK